MAHVILCDNGSIFRLAGQWGQLVAGPAANQTLISYQDHHRDDDPTAHDRGPERDRIARVHQLFLQVSPYLFSRIRDASDLNCHHP